MANGDENEAPSALLTPHQRAYLRGEIDVSPGGERALKSRLRKRVHAGLADLRLLFLHLETEELKKIFGSSHYVETNDDGDKEQAAEFSVAPAYIPSAIALFLRASNLEDADIFPRLGAGQPAFAEFSRRVESGIETYLAREKSRVADVSVQIELSNVRPTQELLEQVEEGEQDVDLATLAALSLAGVSAERLAELQEDAQ